MTFVTLGIASKLSLPEIESALRHSRVSAAGMTVPKATVDKNCQAGLSEHDVGSAGKLLCLEAISQSSGVESASDAQLWLCVAPPNSGHDLRARQG